MHEDQLLLLRSSDVRLILAGRERQILDTVERAYCSHGLQQTINPPSVSLYTQDPAGRAIALPAYIGSIGGGSGVNALGVKWVLSFPNNLRRGLDRASAVVLLSSTQIGRLEAIVEGSIISARRTAASAALAAHHLTNALTVDSAGIIGCGPINYEVVRFLLSVLPALNRITIYDTDPARAELFACKCQEHRFKLRIAVAAEPVEALSAGAVVSLATTATRPHLSSLAPCRAGATILHISLRDFTPEVILACANVADDIEQVCRAETSVHLAERLTGSRSFMRCSLPDVLLGRADARRNDKEIVVFSPFGMGMLDVAVAQLVLLEARRRRIGQVVTYFNTESWSHGPTA